MSQGMETEQSCAAARDALQMSDLNWLLHRAAQRMGESLQAEAVRHGISIRDQLVLSSLTVERGRTQLALGADLGLDKTTLTTVLDKLERDGLVRRTPDPQDRRVRIPEVTAEGAARQRLVADAVRAKENELLRVLGDEGRAALLGALRSLVGADDGTRQPAGSCM